MIRFKPDWKIKSVFYVNFVAMVVVLFWFLQALVLETPYLSYKNSPFPILNGKVFRPGDKTSIKVVRCNSDKVERIYSVARMMSNLDAGQSSYILSPALTSVPPGCSEVISVIHAVPVDAKAGRYKFTGFGEIQGAVRAYTIRWESEPFEVIAN